MPSKDDAPAGSSEVDEIADRFLRGDLTLEEAARGIAAHVPRDPSVGTTLGCRYAARRGRPTPAALLARRTAHGPSA